MAPRAASGARCQAPAPEEEDAGGIAPGLRSLVETYVSYLSGCDACARESLRAAHAADADPSRLRLLSTWRRAPFRTYSERERTALVWAEVVAVVGEAGIGEPLRRQAAGLFRAEELDALTRAVTATRGYRRLLLERSGSAPAGGRGAGRRAATCRDGEGCDLCAAS